MKDERIWIKSQILAPHGENFQIEMNSWELNQLNLILFKLSWCAFPESSKFNGQS